MGYGTPPKTSRNLRIYKLYISGKVSKEDIMKRFGISLRRMYQIIAWVRDNRAIDKA